MCSLLATAYPQRASRNDIIVEKGNAMKNQEYTEHFRDGMRAALNLTRAQANVYANALPVRAGDAFLAGYYAEKRRLRVA
jgi:hypothetical protein